MYCKHPVLVSHLCLVPRLGIFAPAESHCSKWPSSLFQPGSSCHPLPRPQRGQQEGLRNSAILYLSVPVTESTEKELDTNDFRECTSYPARLPSALRISSKGLGCWEKKF